MKKRTLVICLLLCLGKFLHAGDIARFTNLGFSGDSKYFMFAQYGVDEKKAAPYADLFLVDILQNDFVANGTEEYRSTRSVMPGDNGEGALFTILSGNIALAKKFNINHLSRGRILYILLDGEKPKEQIRFRDFNKNRSYTISLVQTATGKGKDVKSSFYIDVTVTPSSGSPVSRRVGHATYQRKGVKSYRIRQIILAPDDRSIIFLIEKEEADTTGANIRYMVETVKIS